jgi:hypothetical protein
LQDADQSRVFPTPVDTSGTNASVFAYERKVQIVSAMSDDIYGRLQNQALGRPLTDDERALALALERAFGSGKHDFADVALVLEQARVKRPSGSAEPWTAAVLEQELAAINESLDAAYAANGIGA